MQSDEVRHAKIAMLETPSGARQTGSAIGRADRVRADDRHLTRGGNLRELSVGRARHQSAGRGAGDRDHHPDAQRPPERAILERLPPQRHCHQHAEERLDHDRRAHEREERRIERRGEVEVARRAAPRLQRDDADLGHEDGGAGSPDQAAHSRPVAQVGEDPREREHVDRRRGGELRRLQPGGRAGDDARVEQPARRGRRPSAPSISSAEAVSGLSVCHSRLSPARIEVTSAICQLLRCCHCQHQSTPRC